MLVVVNVWRRFLGNTTPPPKTETLKHKRNKVQINVPDRWHENRGEQVNPGGRPENQGPQEAPGGWPVNQWPQEASGRQPENQGQQETSGGRPGGRAEEPSRSGG